MKLLKNRLSSFKTSQMPWEEISSEAAGLSYADIGKACEDAIKNAIIDDFDQVTGSDLLKLITERKKFLNKQGPSNRRP